MQRIGIADDKQENSVQIKRILEKHLKGMEVVEIPPYRENILDFARTYRPAVIVLGLHAEGMNGLETAREIRLEDEKVQIIIVSNLEYFMLMKAAVQLKISGYLLEPIDETELYRNVEEALAYYDKLNTERYSLERQESILKETLRYAEYSFIYTALFSSSFDKEYKRYKRILNLGNYGYIINIEIEREDRERQKGNSVYYYLKTIISEHSQCVIGPRIGERIVVFVNHKENEGETDELHMEKRNSMDDVRMAAHIIIGMEEKFGCRVLIGIGGVKALTNIHISYEEAIRCLRYRGKRNVVEIRDVVEEEISKDDYLKLEEQFLKKVRLGSAEAVDNFMALLYTMQPLQMEIRRNKIFGLLMLADYEARSDSKSDLEYFSVEKMVGETNGLKDTELERWACNKVEYILNSARSNRLFRKSESVKNAIRYMEENYMESISLEDIAKYTGVSPQHFSKTFKEEIGMNYIDWLSKLRIENAKKMMQEEKCTVREICYMVGYNDPNYFSRIFKKMEGVSPTEYISKILLTIIIK